MKNLLIALSFALAACGGGSMESPDNHGFGWEFDIRGASGLKLRYSPHLAPDSPFANPAYYEQLIAEVDACAGLSAPTTYVILVNNLQTMELGDAAARGFSHPPVIAMDFRVASSGVVTKHERLHQLLTHNRIIIPNGNVFHDHDSHLFGLCIVD